MLPVVSLRNTQKLRIVQAKGSSGSASTRDTSKVAPAEARVQQSRVGNYDSKSGGFTAEQSTATSPPTPQQNYRATKTLL